LRYGTAGALRAALESRLLTESLAVPIDIARLRRRVVFERLLVRFARDDAWIAKGAAVLEVRLSNRARMTRDLDVAFTEPAPNGNSIREALGHVLRQDPDTDFFEFRLTGLRQMALDRAIEPVWRASVDCRLDGRTFDRVSVDIAVANPAYQSAEVIRLPGSLAFAGIETANVRVIDRRQHFAEKLHAYCRTYGDRPSTRVKDLADVVLLIDDGLTPTSELRDAVEAVFRRRGSSVPKETPDAPGGWGARYEEMAVQLNLSATDVGAAAKLLRTFWTRVQSSKVQV
jgi:predicted nucleotidyltransferase component of viral defense system